MALDRAQLLSGNTAQGDVLSGEVQGVSAGSGISIAANGAISVNPTTITAFVKLNNPAGYNSYVWPTVSGTAGTFLSVDGSGNLSWQTTGATVTVQPQPAPSNPTEGDLWFDCTEGSIKIYQSCVSPAGWTRLGQTGFSAEPGNTTSPDFIQGGGTLLNPYRLPATEVPSGESVLLPYTITVINVAPGSFVPIVDLNNAINDNRFDVNNRYADNSGVLTFQPTITDIPPSPNGATYTALARVGNLSAGDAVYIELPITITNPLFIQPGAISGSPAEGETLIYTQGAINGGQAPYIKAQAWLKNGVYIPGETGISYDVTAADNGSVITVEYTVVDQNGYRATAVTAPVGPIGAIALPSNTSSNPTFVAGDGTITNPFQLTSINVGAGTSALFPQVITITGLDPQEFIPIVDRNVNVNGGRFTFTNSYANGVGDLTFQVRFSDTPESNEGSGYTALIQAGSNSVYFEGTAGVNQALTVSPGYISGNPTLGSTLTYNVGTASGGTTPYIYSYQWQRNENPISGATGTTYVTTSADLGTNLSVKITVKDGQNTTATALSAAFGPISTAAFPPTSWDPLPSNGMDTIPGGESGEYNGTGSVITTTGCIEASVNGGAYKIGSQACVSGDILAIRWNVGASCGGASSGTTITGSLTDGAFTNDYSITIDRVPNSLPNISTTNAALGSLQAKTVPQTITGINTPAYVTYSSTSTGTSIQASKNAGANYTTLATSGTGFSIDVGETLVIRQRVGSTANTTYDAIIRVGDGTNNVGTYDEFTFSSTTTEDAAWPNLPETLRIGPQKIPQTVSATWVDGTGTVAASGCIEVSNNNSTWGTSAAVTAGSTTLYVRWKGSYNGGGTTSATCGNAAEDTKITGRIYGGTYYQDYSLLLKKIPDSFSIPAVTNQATSTTVTSEVLVWKNTNSPANIWAATTSTLTNIQASIDGGAWTNMTSTGTNLYVNPDSSVRFRGTTGSAYSTTYKLVLQVRDQQGGGQDYTWNVTTAAATPEISTPSILTPVNGTVDLVPTDNVPAGITVTGSAYTPLYGAGSTQTGSSWQVYSGSFPLISTNTITGTSVVSAGNANLNPSPVIESPSGTGNLGIRKIWYNPLYPSNTNTYMLSGNNDNTGGALYNYVYRIADVAVDNYNAATPINGANHFPNENGGTIRATAIDIVSVGDEVVIAWYLYNALDERYSHWYVNSYNKTLTGPGTIPSLSFPDSFSGYGNPLNKIVGLAVVGATKIMVSYGGQNNGGGISSSGLPPDSSALYRFNVGTDSAWELLFSYDTGTVGTDLVFYGPIMGGGFNESNAPLFLNVSVNVSTDSYQKEVRVSYDAGDTWVEPNLPADVLVYEAMSNATSTIITVDYANTTAKQVNSNYYYDSYWTKDQSTSWTLITTSDLPGYVSPGSGVYNSPTLYGETYLITSMMSGSTTLPYFATTDPSTSWSKTDVTLTNQSAYEWQTILPANGYGYFLSDTNLSTAYPNWTERWWIRSFRFGILVANPGVTTTTLNISGVEDDGFTIGMGITSTPSGGAGTILTESANQIGVAGSGWSVGQRIQTSPASYSQLPNSPYSGTVGNLTSTFIPSDDLDTNKTYYTRVQYETTNSTAATSDYSSWSSFSTASQWIPTPGTDLGGGYFGGQIQYNGTLYNLILSPTTTGRSANQSGAYLSNSTNNLYSPDWYNDGQLATIEQAGDNTNNFLQAIWVVFTSTGPNAGTFSANNTAGTGINGYNDWYIPSVYEMMVLYYFLKPVTTNNNLGSANNSVFYDGKNPYAEAPYDQVWTATNPGQTSNPALQGTNSDALNPGTFGRYWTSTQEGFLSPANNNFLAWRQTGYGLWNYYGTTSQTRVIRRSVA